MEIDFVLCLKRAHKYKCQLIHVSVPLAAAIRAISFLYRIVLQVNNYRIGHIIDRGEAMDEANGSTVGN